MMKRILASVVVSGLALAGGSVAWAEAPPKATPAEREARKAAAKGRGVHGEKVVKAKDGTFQTVEFDRGKVAAATTTTRIVLERPDGQTVTLTLTEETRYRGIAGAAAIRKGQPAQVISKDGRALLVKQGNPGNKARRAVVPNR